MTIVGVIGDVKDSSHRRTGAGSILPAVPAEPQLRQLRGAARDHRSGGADPGGPPGGAADGQRSQHPGNSPAGAGRAAAVATQRFALQMVGLFAVVALVLALIGIYGVMSFAANRRAKEVAIRTALGATPADTLGLMLGHGLRLIVAGLLVGGLYIRSRILAAGWPVGRS